VGESETFDDRDTGAEERVQAGILSEQIRALPLSPPVQISADATLAEVVEALQKQHTGCVLVVGRDGKLVGIFTERDLLTRVAGKRLDWSACRVADFMTRDPETLRPDDRIAWALNMMHIGGYRNVPLTDERGRPAGLVTVKDIVEYIVELFPGSVLNLPPDPRRRPDVNREQGGG